MQYRTVAGRTRHSLDPIKGSRFVATVAPAHSSAAALAVVREVEAEWPDVRHHCFAWRIDDDQTRAADAGEPGGSAGRPILAQIIGHDLHRTVVVVSRWFGGVKLGVGGLIRAYGGAAGKALDRASVVTVDQTARVAIVHPYADTNAVEAALATVGAVEVETEYSEQVCRILDVPERHLELVEEALRDGTAGRVELELIQ